MKIGMRVKAFILMFGIMLILGCSGESAAEMQETGLPADVLIKIEEYKENFVGLYTAGEVGDGEAEIKVEEREISVDSCEGAVLFVYTDIEGKELRYRLHLYGETGNAVINYYLCDGFVWVSKQTDFYSSYILTAGASDVLYSTVENWILTDNAVYVLHDDGEMEEIEKDEIMTAEFPKLTELADATEPSESSQMPETTEYEALFQQELLFLQQGFRQHNVEESYTVYFAEPEQSVDERTYQDMLLEGEDGFWRERISYTYDQSENWYTFQGEFEPMLVKDSIYIVRNEDAEEFKTGAVYQTELSVRTDLDVPLRFDIPSGPVVYDNRREDGNWGNDLHTYVYVYQDERMGVSVEIEYPQYSLSTDELPKVEEINERIREAFFYGYGNAEEWSPAECMYGEIYRNCEITRMDDKVLSVCIYESNYFRGANHPNEWKSGMTIDLKTGKLLTLQDIIGTERTARDLTDTGAFHCLQIWRDGPLTPEMMEERDKEQVEQAVAWVDEDATDDFYLRPDKLGLTSFIARYYVCMEASLSEIGLKEWEAAPLGDAER
ncbi:MAG: hypothetical protein K2L82_01450 [Lachnospiraceae bacterium]|nr:hypothetical protein [Lachnospiraceae bacterium]